MKGRWEQEEMGIINDSIKVVLGASRKCKEEKINAKFGFRLIFQHIH